MVTIRFFLDFRSLDYAFLDVLTIFVAILMLLSAYENNKLNANVKPVSFLWPVLIPILISSCIVAVINNVDDISIIKFQIKCLVLLCVIKYARSLNQNESILWQRFYSNIIVVSASICVLEFVLGRHLLNGNNISGLNSRWSGNFLWANIACVSFGMILVFVLYSNQYPKLEKFLRSVLLIGGIIATSSLAGIFGTVFAFVYIAWKRGTKYLLYGILISTAIFYLIISKTGVGERIAKLSIPSSEVVLAGRSEDSFTWRLIHWRSVLKEIQKSPLVGHGLGSSSDISLIEGYLPHNDYLRVLVDLGAVGFILLITGFICYWIAVSKSSLPFNLSFVYKSYIILLLISCAAENVINQTTIYLLVPFFIYTGGVHAIPKNASKN